jgi:hypothetical protein
MEHPTQTFQVSMFLVCSLVLTAINYLNCGPLFKPTISDARWGLGRVPRHAHMRWIRTLFSVFSGCVLRTRLSSAVDLPLQLEYIKPEKLYTVMHPVHNRWVSKNTRPVRLIPTA